MQHRTLGTTGLQIAPLVFGGNVLGWTADQARSLSLLDAWLDHGLNAIDTADMYSSWAPGNQGGESETLIGKWLSRSGARDKVILCSKVGMWTQMPGLSARNIEAAIEQSLRRLQTDYLDVYFAHRDDPDTPLDETLETFERLIQSGKVRALGASNYSAPRLQQANDIASQKSLTPFQILQPLYNLFDRKDFEDQLAPVATSQQLGVVVYFALASGFLSGKYRDAEQIRNTARERMLGKYFDPRGLRILDALTQVAQRHQASCAQIALAWLLHQPAVTAPIVSATSVEQLQELVGCFAIALSPEDLQQLDQASRI